MAPRIDVYRQWLSITDENRPLNHYQLLKLKQFEDNTALIRKHYRQLNSHVRKFASGEYMEESQMLLNELAKAMLCLTDAERKREYDATLGRKVEGPGHIRTFEEILLAGKICDSTQLSRARGYADAVGLDMHQAVMQQKLAEPAIVMMAYAESIGLPYIELEDIGVDAALARQVPPQMGRQHSCVPVMIDDGHLLMASPTPLIPDVEEELRLRFGMAVRTLICSPGGINAAVKQYFPPDAPEPVAAPSAQGSSGGSARSKTKQSPASGSEAEKKQRMQFTVIGANFGFMGTVFVLQFLTETGLFLSLGAGVLVAALVAGAVYAVTK